MRKLMMLSAVLMCMTLLSVSCEEVIEFNGDYSGEKMVLYSCVNPDAGSVMVSLSRSKFFLSREEGYLDRPLSGADVKMTVGGKQLVLKESPDRRGLYIADADVREGDAVSVEASCAGLASVSSETVVPKSADFEILSTYSKIVERNAYVQIVEKHFRVRLKDDPSKRDFYRFYIVHRDEEGEMESETALTSDVIFRKTSDMDLIEGALDGETCWRVEGIWDDSIFSGEDLILDFWAEDVMFNGDEMYMYGSRDVSDVNYHSYYSDWGIGIDTVSEDVYKYESSLEDYDSTMGGLASVFGEPVCIHSNISGGIGCFGAISPSFRFHDFPEL